MIRKIINWYKARVDSYKLENWYKVTWDEEFIYRDVAPPGKKSWSDKFRWSEIECVCFEATDYLYSDDIYFFVHSSPESYVIPTESNGGDELWDEVLNRNLFDSELAVKALTSTEGFFCWPESEKCQP